MEQRTHAQQGAGVSDEYRSDKYMESMRHDWAVQGAVATVRQRVHPTTPHMHPHVPQTQVVEESDGEARLGQSQPRDANAPDGVAEALPDSTRAAEGTAGDAVALEVVQVAPTWVGRGAA